MAEKSRSLRERNAEMQKVALARSLESSVQFTRIGIIVLYIGFIALVAIIGWLAMYSKETDGLHTENTNVLNGIKELKDTDALTKSRLNFANNEKVSLAEQKCHHMYADYYVQGKYGCPGQAVTRWENCEVRCQTVGLSDCHFDRITELSNQFNQSLDLPEQKCRLWIARKGKCYLYPDYEEIVTLRSIQSGNLEDNVVASLADCRKTKLINVFKNFYRSVISNEISRWTNHTTSIKRYTRGSCPESGVLYHENFVEGEYFRYFGDDEIGNTHNEQSCENACRAKRCPSWRIVNSMGCFLGSKLTETWQLCRSNCTAESTCMMWSYNNLPQQLERTGHYQIAHQQYYCRMMTGTRNKTSLADSDHVRVRDLHAETKSGLRSCLATDFHERNYISYNLTRNTLWHSSKYHASFIGYGCHSDCSNVGNGTNHVILSVQTPEVCIANCYNFASAFEVTYAIKTETCYCYDQSGSGPTTYSFYEDNAREHLNYVLS